jgi:hypothetical protein
MDSDGASTVVYEWNHTRDDHLIIAEFQFLHATQQKWVESTQRRNRLVFFGLVCIPLLIAFFANFNEQSWLSASVSIVIFTFLLWMIVLKKPNPKTHQANAKKLARRYVDQLPVIPLGRHRLSSDGEVLKWHWVDGKEKNSYPISSIENLSQSEGRLFVYRKGEVTGSIPFHAFGDQQTRLDFIKLIEQITEKEFDV